MKKLDHHWYGFLGFCMIPTHVNLADSPCCASPWINSCVGHENQAYFLGFVTFVPIGCSYASVLLGYYAYTAVTSVRFSPSQG